MANGKERSPPPPCVPRGFAVELNLNPVPNALGPETMHTSSSVMPSPSLPELVNPPPEQDFGSWLLAPRWRGRVHGHGANTRGTHAAMDAATEMRTVDNVIRSDSSVVRGTRGSYRGRGRGSHVSSHTPRAENFNSDMTPLSDFPPDANPTVEDSTLVTSQDNDPPNGSALNVIETQLIGNDLQNSSSHARHNKGKAPLLQRASSPPLSCALALWRYLLNPLKA